MVGLRSPEVTYSLGKNEVIFSVEPLFTKVPASSKVKELKIRYVFYVGQSKQQVRRYANCRLSEGNLTERDATSISSTRVEFSLNVSHQLS